MSATTESLWTVADVAAYLRVTKLWVYHMVRAGKLPVLRLGRKCLRFDSRAIVDFVHGSRG